MLKTNPAKTFLDIFFLPLHYDLLYSTILKGDWCTDLSRPWFCCQQAHKSDTGKQSHVQMCCLLSFSFFWLRGYFYLHIMLSERIIITFAAGRDVPGSFNLHVHLRHGPQFLCAGPSEDNRARGARQCTQRGKKKILDCSWSTVYRKKADGVGAFALC